MKKSTDCQNNMDRLVSVFHDLNRLRGIDRDSFFGRMEILEWIMEEEHAKIGEGWRKFGRYGNVVFPEAFFKGLDRLKNECNFSKEEIEEQMDWTKGQGETYGNPDQLVASVFWEIWRDKNYPVNS